MALFLLGLALLCKPSTAQPVIIGGVYRVTALTPSLCRLEYSPSKSFDDRFTLPVVRREPLPLQVVSVNASTTKLSTSALTIWITHSPPGPFSAANLLLSSASGGVTWRPGAPSTNLNGTWVTSLDCYTDNPIGCIDQYEDLGRGGPGWTYGMDKGLLSRDGWTLLDDTHSVRLVPPTPPHRIPWWSNSTIDAQDLYVNLYGTDFLQAMRDWASILGPPALPPKTSLGVWYSRFYPYSESQLLDEVIGGYAAHDIPLSVLVSDMDWHTEPGYTDPNCSSWGQYDFNASLYPSCGPASDPSCSGFLGKLHSGLGPGEGGNALGHPLALSLNLHSNSGIDKCALRYKEFGRAVGADTSKNAPIPCDFGSEQWAQALFDVYLDAPPLGQGLDYPWPDFNGCGQLMPPFVNTTEVPWAKHLGAAQTLWATYVQGLHQELDRGVRPLVLSRHGGIGNHRIPFFFTGDTLQHEGHLDYQVKRTALAANVMVSVSHDVGGNHFQSDCQPAGVNLTGACAGSSDPANATSSELFLRWVQHGVFSSVLRTHCDHCLRLPWLYTFHSRELFDALRLREALTPMLYTAYRESIDTGIVPVHPVYYHYPTLEDAFRFEHQYMFTRHLLAAPITRCSGGNSSSVSASVWLPPGQWVSWDGARSLNGPLVDTAAFAPSQVPVFAPAFTLLPLKRGPFSGPKAATGFPTPDLQWTLFLGGALEGWGSGEVYEDDGVSLDWRYGVGNSATTRAFANASASGTRLDFAALPAEGTFPGMLGARGVAVQVRGGQFWGSRVLAVTLNGAPVPQSPSAVPGWFVETEERGLLFPRFALNVNLGTVQAAEGARVAIVLSKVPNNPPLIYI